MMRLYRGNRSLLWLYALTNDLTDALLVSASTTSSRILDSDGAAVGSITPTVSYFGSLGHWYSIITAADTALLTLGSQYYWEVTIDFGSSLVFVRQEPFIVVRPYDGQ